MACWYEVYDNEDVQLSTRRKVMALSAIATVSATATLICLSVMASGYIGVVGAAGFIIPVWVLTGVWCIHRLRALRRVAWCVKISDDAVVAYDYARKKIFVPWTRIDRLEWTNRSVLVSGPQPYTIEIPTVFGDFAALSHTLCDHAEKQNVPIYIHGLSIEDTDVYTLYPFLRELNVGASSDGADGLKMT